VSVARSGERVVRPGKQEIMESSGTHPRTIQSAIEPTPHMLWMAREDGSVEFVDQQALDYAGMLPEELHGWGWLKLIFAAEAPLAEAKWKEAIQKGNPYAAKYRLRRNDGSYQWHEAAAVPVRGSNGQIQKWVGTWINIEDRKQAEKRIAELVSIVRNSQDAIIGKTLDGIVTSWNQGAERLFGYRAEEMVGEPVTKLIPGERIEEETEILAQIRRGERFDHYETVRRRRDGRLVDVSLTVSPIRDAEGRLIGASKIARDITERKAAEKKLQESQVRFEAVIESAMDAIITIDETQRVVLFNAAAERMFGCAASQALGRSLDRFIPTRLREAHSAHVRAFAVTGVTSRAMGKFGDLVGLHVDGREFPIEASISQAEVAGAKLCTVILRDITQRKEAERALSRSEGELRALAAKLQRAREEEAIRIARELHDQLGRSLTSIKMELLLIKKIVCGQPSAEGIHAINEKTNTMLEAIDDTVHVVRRISTELRPAILDDLGLAAAIEWQANDFQRRSAVSCIVNVPEEELEVSREQATAFFRIFQEILTNVARHSKAGRLWVHLTVQDAEVVLEVEDDGVGISPEAASQPHALGLVGMRERAAIFGGQVEIAGTPGKGTTVIVRMPIDENPGR
jgi:PAS domain S-box-containing protein